MSLKYILGYFFVSVLSGISLMSHAEESITDIIRSRIKDSNAAAQSSQSSSNIPGYSDHKKEEIENKLNDIEVGLKNDHLQREGEKTREKQLKENPDGVVATVVEATDLKRVAGFEGYSELEMFKEADKYMKDPVEQFNLINKSEACKEKVNNKKRGFYRKQNEQTFIDEIEELKSCEAPINTFKCSKTLEVSCSKISECDFGGIVKESVDHQISFDASNGFLTIGTDCDNCLTGICATFDKTVVFSINRVDRVSSFHLVHVKFDDYIQLTLNGHTFYVGPDGGTHVEVKTREIEKERLAGTRRRRITEKYKEKLTEVYNGDFYRPCERSESFNREVDIDLRPFLVEGKNTLQMRIIVSGAGEGWLKIKAKEQCCANNDWIETWVESCEQRN